MTKKLFVCVYLGCNKNIPHVIDIVTKKELDGFITNLGGNPKEELLEILENCSDSSLDEHSIFMELDCQAKYKVFKIDNYKFNGKFDGCKCTKDLVYCVRKGKYSVNEIVDWVKEIII